MSIDTPLEGKRALTNMKNQLSDVLDGIIADRIEDEVLRHEMKQATQIGIDWVFSCDYADDVQDAMYRWYGDAYGSKGGS